MFCLCNDNPFVALGGVAFSLIHPWGKKKKGKHRILTYGEDGRPPCQSVAFELPPEYAF